jgi:hypothetical protein
MPTEKRFVPPPKEEEAAVPIPRPRPASARNVFSLKFGM